jgi:hypothetical protein
MVAQGQYMPFFANPVNPLYPVLEIFWYFGIYPPPPPQITVN